MPAIKTKAQYRAALKKIGLSVVGAADVLGISRRHSQRIAAGADVPRPVGKLLNLIVRHEVKPEDVV